MPSQSDGTAYPATTPPKRDDLDFIKPEGENVADGVPDSTHVALNGHKTPPLEQHATRDNSRRGLKRKLAEPSTPPTAKVQPKPISPPWRKFEAEGPTSFVTEGRRRSGRTNVLPLELQPQSTTRRTRAAFNLVNEGKRQSGSPASNSKPQRTPDTASSTPPSKQSSIKTTSNSKSNLRHQVPQEPVESSSYRRKQSLTSTKESRNPTDNPSEPQPSSSVISSAHDSQQPTQILATSNQSHPRPVRSLRLNFKRPPLPVLNPGNVQRRKHASFVDFLAQDNLIDEGEGPFSDERVRKEASSIQRLQVAAMDDGVLAAPWWIAEDLQLEPLLQPTHSEYLSAHVEMFVRALKNERTRHLKEAKALAHAAAHAAIERVRKKEPQAPKTAEQLAREEYLRKRAFLQPALKELKNKWVAVANLAKQRKLARLEQEQEALGKQALSEMLERSTKALEERRVRRTEVDPNSTRASDDEGATGSATDEYDYASSLDDYDDGDSSSSDHEESDEPEAARDDQLSREELLEKYGIITARSSEPHSSRATSISELPQSALRGQTLKEPHSEEQADVSMSGVDQSYPELEDVAADLLDSEHSESDSDENLTESSNESSEDDSDDDESDDDEGPASLYQLLSAKSRKSLTEQMKITDETSLEETADGEQLPDAPAETSQSLKQPSDVNSTSDPRSPHATPPTTVGSSSPNLPEAQSNHEHDNANNQSVESPAVSSNNIKTVVPSLLRGQLREYQHHGLDWLAGMYATDTNGILADEMGLGKTIQTIALLAHLATEKEVWGPHLIVVPTSVMLNWEMEFKKWCPGFKIVTYYGNQEERRAKRRGWLENSCHVCITSYELAVQDANSLKRRPWHYLILDEAHNIKNFRSQRWQTLLNFRSQARLLLTGTPLQNNLSELWSLLFFLAPETDEEGRAQFSDLKTFTTSFKHPVEQILDHGREALDDEARGIVEKLHKVLRPHLLRRLKAEVEKQMPKKYEHVVKCRLSKRQRQLYDGFMGLAGTRESFASGNYMSIIACLMQLRKVCNHPDLFEERPILTSYAMPKSAVADYEIKEFLVRRQIQQENDAHSPSLDILNLWSPNIASSEVYRTPLLSAKQLLMRSTHRQKLRISQKTDVESFIDFQSSNSSLDSVLSNSRLEELRTLQGNAANRIKRRPVYPSSLLEELQVDRISKLTTGARQTSDITVTDRYLSTSKALQDLLLFSPALSSSTTLMVQKYGCVTPAVVAPQMAKNTLMQSGRELVQAIQPRLAQNPFHESQTRLSIAFPDKNLIQYDCGKLQQLDRLLRDLTAGGHRALIFTQMTKVLNILEQFLNLHGYRYLRLDGATKVEQRQALTDQFNRDARIPVFILSSRSGGLGINLTGADTVIFYDLDWNPAMDKQCQDRCHRIGQTRDVHIYRFISEGTIEANILRKSNQKRMLDDVMIQEGEFTTDVFNRELADELDADADAALDMVIDSGDGSTHSNKQNEKALANAEDKEDHEAAILAHKEYVHTDDADFRERPTSEGTGTNTPNPQTYDSPRPTDTADDSMAAEEEEPGSYEEYMLRFMEWDLRDLIIKPVGRGKKPKKGKAHEIRIRR